MVNIIAMLAQLSAITKTEASVTTTKHDTPERVNTGVSLLPRLCSRFHRRLCCNCGLPIYQSVDVSQFSFVGNVSEENF